MKKRLPLAFTIILCGFLMQSYSQSLQLKTPSDTIYTTSDKSEGYASVMVKNISSNAAHVRVDRVSEVLSGTQTTYFCWEQCYPPTTSSSSGSIKIDAGDSTLNFTAHVMTNGEEGISEAVFLFSNEDVIDDTVSIHLFFDVTAPSGIKKLDATNDLVKITSNNNLMTIQFKAVLPKLNIAIYSMSGQLVYSNKLTNAKDILTIPVSSLTSGIYTVQLRSSDFYYNQKISVSR